jgi:DNA invertase Pin-like site-specific DNA recombinase
MNISVYDNGVGTARNTTPSATGPMRAVLYSRVSTEEQAVSGLGLTAQRDRTRTAVTARGWSITAELADEGISGKIRPAERPGLAEAIDQLCNGQADVLVVAKLDRLTRTTRDLLDLLDQAEKCRFGIVALDSDVDTTTAAGRLVATMVGAVAEWERRVIGERTKAALAVKKAQGARLGRPVSTPAPIRRRVAQLHADGVSLARIAEQINADGHRTSAGTMWTKAGVQRLVGSLKLDHLATDRHQPDAPDP